MTGATRARRSRGIYVSRNSSIAAIVPPALLVPFYLWIGAIWMFAGRPPTVDHLPPWLKRWDVVGMPLVLLIVPPVALLVVLICIGLLPFQRLRGPATAYLLASVTVFFFLMFIDPGGWFHWFLD